MGQKTHPKAFRLGITQEHLSNWYAKKSNYPSLLQKDFVIRQTIEEIFEEFLPISSINILRGGSETNINSSGTIVIKALHPRMRDIYKKVINEFLVVTKKKDILTILQKKTAGSKRVESVKYEKIKELLFYFFKIKTRQVLRKLALKLGENFSIRFEFLKNTFEDATLIAKFIGNQIKKRAPFRRVIKQTIKKAELAGLKGIKIEVSGRLNGIDIARSEWKREGKIPLHTLIAKIDYAYHYVNTVYGIIGLKVWIFKN